jgi:hypothetical protein
LKCNSTANSDNCCYQALHSSGRSLPSILKTDPKSGGNPHKQTTENADKQKRRLGALCAGQDDDGSDHGETDEEEANALGNRFSCDLHSTINTKPVRPIGENQAIVLKFRVLSIRRVCN